ncbi:peptidoglycan bridge formation glycyltransferase FemA/FemB family protein [Leucobacter viscericola]|uniref:Peptidoglycan bridge formation glycyltransferase FemA/FemB family protein n=1 Tax=Leucobacter viscericola TaxID=2714935 RepID=A0A6G7XDG0_9MICO|nr:peptidoglycan bridge formation glycyltransferase FemA/FemB family protein [Leucobacter viscericola]QIK62437.1 peptidoglycan bridge formation glycyltransferase FemA/FemB family protein [Leucobacter viscericola]
MARVVARTAGGGEVAARLATDREYADWDALVAANPGGGEVWGGSCYLDVKQNEGRYRQYRLMVTRQDRPAIAVAVLAKRVPFLGEWWHLPAGPAGEDTAAVLEVSAAVADLARSRGAFLLKIEPRLGPDAAAAIQQAGYLETVRVIPNPSTVLMDVSGTEDEVFARLGKKARNAINRAGRDGIVVTRVMASDENCAALYKLLRETAEGRFVLRSEKYYREFWQTFKREGTGQMFFAHAVGADGSPELVAGAFAMALGAKTTYKDGASVRAKNAYGASHALQWGVIRWANERGAVVHDFCGAPPADRADDKTHPLHGVGQFKRSFAPEITDYVGAFELPLNPRAYSFWVKLGDRLMRRWSLAVRKDPYY